jgi:hypothetical protein
MALLRHADRVGAAGPDVSSFRQTIRAKRPGMIDPIDPAEWN